jgi:hypothetical protein
MLQNPNPQIMKNITVFLLLLAPFSTALGQGNAIDIIKKVNESYGQNKAMMMTAQYDLFANYATAKVYESKQGVLKKEKAQLSYKIGDMERFENKKFKIIANHEEKLIIVQPNLDTDDGKGYNMDPELQKILAVTDNVQMEDKGTYWLLSMPLALDDIERVNMSVEKSTYFISKAIIYYRNLVRLDIENKDMLEEKPRLEITYKADTSPKFAKNDLSQDYYIRSSSGNKIQLSEQFKNYELVNYCEKPKTSIR